MDAELSPYLQEVQDRFFASYVNGGIEAAERMIDELELDVKLANALDDGGRTAENEAVDALETKEDAEVMRATEMSKRLTVDHRKALARLSYASVLLDSVKDK